MSRLSVGLMPFRVEGLMELWRGVLVGVNALQGANCIVAWSLGGGINASREVNGIVAW